MYPDRWRDPEELERERQERLKEERQKKEFEDTHCMRPSEEGDFGPPGCCLAPKLFGRACKKHLVFSLAEVLAIGVRLLGLTGLNPKSATELVGTVIAAVIHEGVDTDDLGPVKYKGTKKAADLMLQKLWTRAVGTEGYNKDEWKKLERFIQEASWHE